MPTPAFPALSRTLKVGIVTDYDDSTTLRSKFEDGLVQTWPNGTKIRRKWKIAAAQLNAADYAAIDTFVRTTVLGGAGMFTFGIPAPVETVTVRFAQGGLPTLVEQVQNKTGMHWQFQATLEEV